MVESLTITQSHMSLENNRLLYARGGRNDSPESLPSTRLRRQKRHKAKLKLDKSSPNSREQNRSTSE